MNSALLMTVILLLGLVIGLASEWLIHNIMIHVTDIKEQLANNRRFKEKQAEVEKMKANGDFHEWVSIPSFDPAGGTMLVCKRTGWCPTLKGFISTQHINRYLDNIQAEEEYKSFRAARIQLISAETNLSVSEVERIVESIFTMKKDFYVGRIAKLQKEIEAKAAAVKNEQPKV